MHTQCPICHNDSGFTARYCGMDDDGPIVCQSCGGKLMARYEYEDDDSAEDGFWSFEKYEPV